jgi:hypothetical protein
LTDAFVNVASATNGFEPTAEQVAELRLFPGGLLGPIISTSLEAAPSRQNATGTTPIGDMPAVNYNSMYPSIRGSRGSITYNLIEKPTSILYPFNAMAYTTAANPGTTFDGAIDDEITNGTECDVTVYIRFLQYDIDQSYNYVIQSPQLTR